MSKNLLLGTCLGTVALGLISGCAAKPIKPTTQTAVRAESAPAPTPRPSGAGEILAQAVAKPSAPFDGEGWEAMFDGKSLAGWRETQFAGRGEVECKSGLIVLNMGNPFTGINYTNDFPRLNYEVAFDAMRVEGSDFFCALTFPVADSCCSLIVGGWGGGVVGLSSLDGMDASENETSQFMRFDTGRWYRIRVRVTRNRIEAWIDKNKVVNVVTSDRRISVRPGDIELSQPFGLAAWQTTGALREIKWRPVTGPEGPSK